MTVVERFLKYVQVYTTSDEESSSVPSTQRQKEFGLELVKEMRELGVEDAKMDENGYIFGSIPATKGRENEPIIGLISHMDTAPTMKGDDVKPQIVKAYNGREIILNDEKGIVMSPEEFPHLLNYIGQDLIVTDGTTLLGADDKAGIAEIMTLIAYLMKEDTTIEHGTIRIGFTPDEEIGRGAKHFDVPKFHADFAYTVDGGILGELEYENFNAAAAIVTIHGANIHPGEAKNKMKNSILIGMEFHSMLPVFENPAYTEGYEGFQHLSKISGMEEVTRMDYIIRDHDKMKFEKKKERFIKIQSYLNDKYGADTVIIDMQDKYYNMKEKIEPHMYIVERAKEAFLSVGIEPIVVPIRGGTDGSRLSFMGLPCPNLSTGGHNFHGRYEYIPISSMEKMVEVLKNIVKVQ